jgi:hypothetical protein
MLFDCMCMIQYLINKTLARKLPNSQSFQSWQCGEDHRVVEFLRISANEADAAKISIDIFMVNGKLPLLNIF